MTMGALSMEVYMGFFFLQVFSILEAVTELAISLKSLSMMLK